MNPALLMDLVGGTQSRPASSDCEPRCGQPGGAGGALALIACRRAVVVSGLIDAGGGGGDSGSDSLDTATAGPGGGGGSGGYIVLQGMQVTVFGELYANGGGGGAGAFSVRCDKGGQACGADGTRSVTESARGGQPGNGGAGGDGGRQALAPKPGRKRATIDPLISSGGRCPSCRPSLVQGSTRRVSTFSSHLGAVMMIRYER